ncbi:SAM-dependent methyltransferase [Rhodopila globiformis]|uniref:hypothetical protein n=1 Tax=Rhodopila globiformis TaxID=1071 RepID=UPI0011B0D8E6|nr:hypothetical protein [Rhodopila globiformis]
MKTLGAGLPPSTPAVAVENALRLNEAHVHGTLAELPDLLDASRLAGPNVVLIGSVVSLSHVAQEAAHLAA